MIPSEGASPRLRGKRRPARRPCGPDGCIPAPAGETSIRTPHRSPGTVHPRACGGNCAREAEHGRVEGASPRLRGKPFLSQLSHIRHSPPIIAGFYAP